MIGFRIWYGDGSTSEGEWGDLHDEDVQFVYQSTGQDKWGRPLGLIANGRDFYWLDDGLLASGDTPGPEAKSGKWCDDYGKIETEFRAWLVQHIT